MLSLGKTRSPFVEPTARGLFFGIGLWTKKADMVRSIYKGVGFSAKDSLQLFKKAEFPPKAIDLVGGGARSNIRTQIICEITNYVLRVSEGEELGAKGCAIQAGVVAGFYNDPADGPILV